jgi:hypothetical protein
MTKTFLIMLATTTLIVGFVEPVLAAGRPGGFHMGPPSSVMMGPPSGMGVGSSAAATMGPPSGVVSHFPEGARFGSPPEVPNEPATANVQVGARASGSIGPAHADRGITDAANILGNLNAAHAAPQALAHASSHSIVGALANYKTSMISAQASIKYYSNLVGQDETAVASAQANLNALQNSGNASQSEISSAQAQLASAQQQLSSDQAELAAAQSEVVTAQNTLATASNKELTPQAIVKIDALLGISS